MPSKADTAVARTIGIDTGKNTLHMIGLDEKGAIVLREKVSRTRIAARFVNLPPCLVGIEAGMASHHVARELVALGHEVKQVPPAYSKPFRQGHKNDFRDAHAVAEAVERPSTRCVPIKTEGQLDLQASMALPFAKDVTLLPGLAWCRSKCRRVIAPSLAALPSAETAIYACSSSRAPAPSSYDRRVGQNTALDRGSPPQRGDCIAMFWQLRSPTSWRGSLGLSWRRDVAMRLASSRVSNRRRRKRA